MRLHYSFWIDGIFFPTGVVALVVMINESTIEISLRRIIEYIVVVTRDANIGFVFELAKYYRPGLKHIAPPPLQLFCYYTLHPYLLYGYPISSSTRGKRCGILPCTALCHSI
ncbi:hypothetical protein KQX54_018741 [Cotesia glomerata]|uniref:Uncharacterized protein n=1 Tax=Cotesia glomerata TaxID=32391 RepID=A0AAV7JA29_COTGL|nr:hypothetical protein KQX54_018741 [Cotesia glomerata]